MQCLIICSIKIKYICHYHTPQIYKTALTKTNLNPSQKPLIQSPSTIALTFWWKL